MNQEDIHPLSIIGIHCDYCSARAIIYSVGVIDHPPKGWISSMGYISCPTHDFDDMGEASTYEYFHVIEVPAV